MHIVEVVPLTKIPIQKSQILSYFSTHQLNVGYLILIPLAKRLEKAVLIESHEVKNHKIDIKEAEYELRPIKKVISHEAVLTKQQIKLALWLGQYYFASPGLFMKMMIKKNQKLKIPGLAFGLTRAGKNQKLILVPEVSQIKNFEGDQKTTIIHSGLKAKELKENWQKAASEKAEIIIGTRMAIFAPFLNLKEIIIEDETNSGHRSWDMFPHYRTHEAAKELKEIFRAKLFIKSETPSIESCYFEKQKCSIKEKNHKNIETKTIDLRQELKEGNYSIFSRELQKAINKALENKQQVILFINRRGAATFVLCRDCGYAAKCSNCEAPLTYHFTKYGDKLKPILICHHCGQKQEPPTVCPKCQGHRIKAFGSGTQRVEIEAEKLFKSVKIVRLDSDVAPTPAEQNRIIQEFKEKKADILIGTQMILNALLGWQKKASLVAFVSADTMMHLPDFRSDERLWQTIYRLKKLSGSRLIIQTYNPQNKIFSWAEKDDFKSFYQEQIETRKVLKYPPFSQIIKLTFRHRDPKKSANEAKIIFAKLTQQLKTSKISKEAILELIGPAPAFISKQKQKYIWQIIIKVKSIWLAKKSERQNLLNIRNNFLMNVPQNWEIDIDPETIL